MFRTRTRRIIMYLSYKSLSGTRSGSIYTNIEIVLSFSCKLLNFPSSSRDLLQARIGFILENWMSHYSGNMKS